MHPYMPDNSSSSTYNRTTIPQGNTMPNYPTLPPIQHIFSQLPFQQTNQPLPSPFNVTHPSTMPLIPQFLNTIIQTTSPSPQVSRFTLQETIPPSPSLKRKNTDQEIEYVKSKKQKLVKKIDFLNSMYAKDAWNRVSNS